MKNILILSFNIIRQGECAISYSLGTLLAYVNKYKPDDINITHWAFNVSEPDVESQLLSKIDSTDMNGYDRIAMSVYVWSDGLVKQAIARIKKQRFRGLLILGGNQITYTNLQELSNEYPTCKMFIVGYGENALLHSFTAEKRTFHSAKIINKISLLNEIPSPYLENVLKVESGQRMVRMETKRGCLYSCNFCAHRELNAKSNKIYNFPLERVYSELDLFKEKGVHKINIIDPIFNYGDHYLTILEYIKKIDLKAKVSLQTKFELIAGRKGEAFIDLCSKINVVLEFGLQTISENECQAINRFNRIEQVSKVMATLNEKGIDYEVDLIYGLPLQTVASFKESIAFLRKRECPKIMAYPLMLLRGTKLYYEKEKWKLKDAVIKDHTYPVVIQSSSFTEIEWNEMHCIAQQLNTQYV